MRVPGSFWPLWDVKIRRPEFDSEHFRIFDFSMHQKRIRRLENTSNSSRGPRRRSFRRWNHQHLHAYQHQKPSRNKDHPRGGGTPARGCPFVSRGLLMLVFMQMLMIPTPKGSTSRSSTRIRGRWGLNAGFASIRAISPLGVG